MYERMFGINLQATLGAGGEAPEVGSFATTGRAFEHERMRGVHVRFSLQLISRIGEQLYQSS
jgi:hypothetical protein